MKRTTDGHTRQAVSHSSWYSSGFTIVEVMIVLAIAGLIMLIVFEAIPSLTRASRNGRRKQDVSIILDAVSSYELKNSDNFPQDCGGSGATACDTSEAGFVNDYFLQFVKNDLSYYSFSTDAANSAAFPYPDPVILVADYPQTNGSDPSPNTNTELVRVYDYEKCDPNGGGHTTSTGADYNDIVALYALEGGNGTSVPQCQEL